MILGCIQEFSSKLTLLDVVVVGVVDLVGFPPHLVDSHPDCCEGCEGTEPSMDGLVWLGCFPNQGFGLPRLKADYLEIPFECKYLCCKTLRNKKQFEFYH